ncbi:aromatic amino acid lyase, partial [Brevundimonas sp.]|uniref:aromatic amino acid lyase n=1 Tax=Brevundimonas sp. TaxID=1871086 RepID=UPI00391CD6E6
MTHITIGQDPLTLNQLRAALNGPLTVSLTPAAWANVDKGAAVVAAILAEGRTVYGINTGF